MKRLRASAAGFLIGAALACLFVTQGSARPAAAMAACRDDTESAPPPIALTPKERAEVLAGRVILRDVSGPERKGKTYEAIGLLPGTLDEAFAVITDYERYPEFMPRMAKLVMVEPAKAGCIVECTVDVPISSHRRYRLHYAASRFEDGFRVTWEKLPWPELKPGETIADTRGYWLVRRLQDGGQTCALYHVYADPGRVPLGMTRLANSLSKGGLRDVLVKTRERIRKLHAAPLPGARDR